jgi:hypothetical protein
VVQLPADLKHPSKLLGTMACRAAQRKVLEHVALGHGNRVVQRKSPPLFGFNLLPVASLLSSAAAAASSPMSMEATSLSPPPAHRLPCVEAQAVPTIQDRSWQCHLCTYKQDFVPGSRTCVMCHSTRRQLHCASQRVGKFKLVVRTRGSGKSDCPNVVSASGAKPAYLLAVRNALIYGWMQKAH